jgi:hypothetical protein
MEKKKLKSLTLPLMPSGSSTSNFQKPTIEIFPINIDQLEYQDLSKWIQPRPSNTSLYLRYIFLPKTSIN